MLYACIIIAVLFVVVSLFVYDMLTSYHRNAMSSQSYDLRMKHIHSLFRMRAFQGEHLMSKEEMLKKFDEEIGKV